MKSGEVVMKRVKWSLCIVFIIMCNLMFAEDNNKYLYLKGETDGVEIKNKTIIRTCIGI